MSVQANTTRTVGTNDSENAPVQHSIMGLDARYSTQYAIDDISLRGVWIVRFAERWLGNAESLEDAQMSARLHASIFDSSPSACPFAAATGGAIIH